MLVNPRLGTRRWRGICPPSKPRIIREPDLDRWPLCPRVEVLPMPLPMPRPTRLRLAVAPLGGRNVERLVDILFPLFATALPAVTRFPSLGVCFRSPDHARSP